MAKGGTLIGLKVIGYRDKNEPLIEVFRGKIHFIETDYRFSYIQLEIIRDDEVDGGGRKYNLSGHQTWICNYSHTNGHMGCNNYSGFLKIFCPFGHEIDILKYLKGK